MPELYIGLMSGTSLDGIDGVVADFAPGAPRLLTHAHQSYPPSLRTELAALNQSGPDELQRGARAANELTRAYAGLVKTLLARASLAPSAIAAVGCHGQTVRHQPADGYTLQLVNGALLAELTSITAICDFRSRDVAAGGQGAPLVPAFHRALFAQADEHRVIVNIGGIANLTNLPVGGDVTGFDCGPGNLLLDAWSHRHLGQPFDRDGMWARTGEVVPALLANLEGDEYFRRPPPKSTGREMFNLEWLEQHLSVGARPEDVQATLVALTARAIAAGIKSFCGGAAKVYLCGGGARNRALVDALSRLLAPRAVDTTDALGIDAEHVEALAFAWLACETLNSRPGNLPAVTGARGPRILGAIYPS